jgi:vitamin B12 transporter
MPRSLLLALTLLLAAAAGARAQFPGELAGRVTSAATGEAVEAAVVEVPAAGRSTLSDAAGTFHLRGLEPGVYRVTVRRIGYLEHAASAEVHNGRTARLAVALAPVPLEVEGVEVSLERPGAAPGERVGRAEIERSGARTAGDVVRRAPGVVLREDGPGGRQTVSIRGSGADAVLVLVDGVALNDPVTGEADLSTVPAHAVESVTVVPGAQSARYGPRAEAGVVLIETRRASGELAARVGAGSLGERSAAAEAGWAGRTVGWSVGGHARRVEGAFDHERVPGIDPTPQRRINADLAEWSGFAAAQASAAGGELRLRVGAEGLERGLPGRGYAPSAHARQELDRARGSLAWRRAGAEYSAGASLGGVSQAVRYADPAPPAGLPYDETTRVRSLELRSGAERVLAAGPLRGYGAGVDGLVQHVSSGSLGEHAPRTRADAGAFVHATAGTAAGPGDLELTASLRADRDGVAERWRPSHSLAARWTAGTLSLHLAHRSAYSPPTLGDQFFREGVAVAPNPDLRPERIPSEWEAGAAVTRDRPGFSLGAGARAFTGDVKGMIVWLPDFRFVWSPRNTDVRRRGAEGWIEAAWPERALRLTGSYTLAAVTYDREGDPVQVAYRPRHSAQLRAEWAPGPWRLTAGALLVGDRYPVPAAVNRLPRFWTFDLDLAREWRAGPAALTAAVHVDRLLDEKESLIFGFPEAGRRIRLELRARRADRP